MLRLSAINEISSKTANITSVSNNGNSVGYQNDTDDSNYHNDIKQTDHLLTKVNNNIKKVLKAIIVLILAIIVITVLSILFN